MDKKFNIKVTDITTGEVLLDQDFVSLISGICTDDGKPMSVGIGFSDSYDVASSIVAASECASKIMDDNSNIKDMAVGLNTLLTKAKGRSINED